jgi:hypothetical protein
MNNLLGTQGLLQIASPGEQRLHVELDFCRRLPDRRRHDLHQELPRPLAWPDSPAQ